MPVCYAPAGDGICIPIDEKPKRTPPERLKRVRNIAENPNVAFVVDHYDDREWSRLGWLMIRGRATVLRSGDLHSAGVEGLVRRYPQYRTMALADLPVIAIRPERVNDWGCL